MFRARRDWPLLSRLAVLTRLCLRSCIASDKNTATYDCQQVFLFINRS